MPTKHSDSIFREFIDDKNYLAAAEYLKERVSDQFERTALTGKLVSVLVEDLGTARRNNERERVTYLRSLLAWLLRSYPGLAPLYREHIRMASGNHDVLPEFARGVKNVGDVLSGKKTVQEGVDDAAEPLETIGEQAGELLRDGLNRIGDLLSGFSQTENRNNPDAANADSSEPIEVKIEDSDDPLPNEIHKTNSNNDRDSGDNSTSEEN